MLFRSNWEKFTLSKKEGGMSFRDLKAFNLAMLAKKGGGCYMILIL